MIQPKKVEPYEKGQSLILYSRGLAEIAHAGMDRDTGEPYSIHPRDVSDKLSYLVLDVRFNVAAQAAGFLHDVAEDADEFEVYNPFEHHFSTEMFRRSDRMYLNDLLREAGQEGKFSCYIVDKVSFRQDSSYAEYMDRIFSFSGFDGVTKSLDMIAALLKFVDRKVNCIPGEVLNPTKILAEYHKFKDADIATLREFYKRKKITDTFISNGGIFYDEELFVEALQDKFETKKVANAWDNLLYYLPETARFLLSDSTENEVDNSSLYDKNRVSELIKKCGRNSLQILDDAGFGDPLKVVHIAYRSGKNRDRKFEPGYMHWLKKLRLELREKQ